MRSSGSVSFILCLALVLVSGGATYAAVPFDLEVIDPAYGGNERPGYSKTGDLDGDGSVDVVAGGGHILQWYKAPNWDRHFIDVVATAPFVGANGVWVFDVDGDTDLDVVTTEYLGDLIWWENPGSVLAQGLWTARTIDTSITDFMNDIVLGDIGQWRHRFRGRRKRRGSHLPLEQSGLAARRRTCALGGRAGHPGSCSDSSRASNTQADSTLKRFALRCIRGRPTGP